MGNFRPLPTSCWQKYLTHLGFSYNRTTASHDQWTKKGFFRTITVRGKDKDTPPLHLKTSCKTLGVKIQDVYAWADKNC